MHPFFHVEEFSKILKPDLVASNSVPGSRGEVSHILRCVLTPFPYPFYLESVV